MSHRTRKAAVLVALFALSAVLALPGVAHAADPSPPYLSSSSPGGYPLYGYHEDTNVAAGRCWAGLQYRYVAGVGHHYRLWFKCQGIPSRALAVRFDAVTFDAWGFASYRGAASTASSTGPIYRTGGWHRVYGGEDASVSARITTGYAGGGTARTEAVCSYRIKARYPYPTAGPAC